MDLKEIAEAYQLVYEKKKLDPVGKEDDDVDNDGDVDSSDEYLKKRRAAIGKAMGKDGDKEEDEEEKKDKKKDKKESLDLVSAYRSMYEHHKKDADGNTIPHEDEIEEEVISETPKGDAGKSKSTKIADRSARSYGGSGTYGAKYNAPARDVIHDMKRGVKKDKGHVDRPGKKTSDFIDDRSSHFHTSGQGLKGSTKHGKSDYDEPSRKKDMVIKFKTRKEEIDLSFVDQLTEQELDNLVEGVVYDLLDEGIELDAIEGAFTEYLEEAKITFGSDTAGEDEEVGTKTRSEKNPTPQEKMNAKLKKRKEEKAKASKEKTEKFKKAVGKAVTKVKAKMHGGMADYAGKRGLMPTKSAQTAKAPTKPTRPNVRNKKYQGSGGSDKLQTAKGKYAKDIKQYKEVDMPKYEKTKAKKQTSGQLKVSMLGGGAKDTRSKLRSAVFKDVKDRVGKKVKAVADAPKKAVEGIKKAGSSVKKGIKGMVNKAARKSIDTLSALEKRTAVKAEGLDMFDTVTAYLIDEGFAKDFDHAQRIMVTLDSALIEEVHAEQLQILEAYGGSTDKPMLVTNADKKGNTPAYQNMMKGMKSKVTGKPMYKKADHMESLEDAYLKVYEEEEKAPRMQKGAMAYDGPNKPASEAKDRIIAKTKKKMAKKTEVTA